VNSKRVVFSIILILIMMTPAVGVSNLDLTHESTLFILKAESGDPNIDMGVNSLKLGFRDVVSDVIIRGLERLDTLDANGEYLIIVGHGTPEGLETSGKTVPWDELYAAIRSAGPERAFVLACYSPVDEEIIGFNAPIDARAGAILISLMICNLLKPEKQSNFPIQDAIMAQRAMRNPLNRYVYFVHGYFGNNSDFTTMVDRLVYDGLAISYSEIRYFDYFEHYGLELPQDVLLINALHQYTSISTYANHFADELCSLPPGSHVSIVAHSMGGIITREMLGLYRADLDALGIFIDKVITLGTPNLGTWLANPAHPWAVILTLIGGLINYAQYWPSSVFHSLVPVSPLIVNLNADPISYNYGIDWYTAAGYDPIMSDFTYSIHLDNSDPLVAVGMAHLSYSSVAVTYDGIDHTGLIQNTGSAGTFSDVYSWLCSGDDYDGDGLTDDAELYTWGTNPSDIDSDNDGLSDYEEVTNADYKTDPNNPNTDGDAIDDGTEIAWSYNPLDSTSPIQARSLIQNMQIYSDSTISVTVRSLTGVTKVMFYAQYKDYWGSWTSYQLIGTDSSAPFIKSWAIPKGYAEIRVKVEAYNSGNIYLGCDTAYMTLGSGDDPVPI